MPEHVHVHAPHELTEVEEGEHVSGRERVLEIAAALLMSIATLGIAWSGYQAARWSGLQSERYTQASSARSIANRSATDARELRLQDLVNFNRWLDLQSSGDTETANLYERRFREEFRPAFAAWLAQDPLHNERAIPSPFQLPEYVLKDSVKSDRLEAQGAKLFEEGTDATDHADAYVFITVFFAAVLFFAGMSLRFAWPTLRAIVLGLAALLLVYGFVRLALLPTY